MKKTPLHQSHIDMGAKMGEFAGYDMPLYYDKSVMAEHDWVREQAGLFDVSHMGQVCVTGADAQSFFERITPSSYGKVKSNGAKYTVMTNEAGGIVDDLIVTKIADDRFFAVINAGCKDKDVDWMTKQAASFDNLDIDVVEGRALIALQGPQAQSALAEVLGGNASNDLDALAYMQLAFMDETPFGDLIVSRLGYTGEDGFEISVVEDKAEALWNALCALDSVKPIGLAARDSLRLDMGYPLYGHDIDDTTSPVEAGIGWVIGKLNDGFIGHERILHEKQNGARQKRVGFVLTGKGVAREGAEIYSAENPDQKLGMVTSGGFSPTRKESVAMGYINKTDMKDGDAVLLRVRGRDIEARIAPLPFVQASTKAMSKKPAAA